MEVLKLTRSSEFQQMEALKGKALEDWNWQIKEQMTEKREGSGQKSQRQDNFNDEEPDSLEKEILKIDQELEQENAYYFRRVQVSGKSSVKRRATQKTPSTMESFRNEDFED